MPGEKYVVLAKENPFQIAVRNILNPRDYVFLGNCNDSVSMMRLIRNYNPDFVVVDLGISIKEIRNLLETIDDEMLCSCILMGDFEEDLVSTMLDKSRTMFFCQKAVMKELLIHTAEMANISFKRVYQLERKLKEMTENYESRKLVERAKWILMEREKISENEAYDRIRKKSMDNRESMKNIADAIIFTYEISKR